MDSSLARMLSIKRKKFTFEASLSLELANVPVVTGVLFSKVRLFDGGFMAFSSRYHPTRSMVRTLFWVTTGHRHGIVLVCISRRLQLQTILCSLSKNRRRARVRASLAVCVCVGVRASVCVCCPCVYMTTCSVLLLGAYDSTCSASIVSVIGPIATAAVCLGLCWELPSLISSQCKTLITLISLVGVVFTHCATNQCAPSLGPPMWSVC